MSVVTKDRSDKPVVFFVYSAGVILILTAIAKVISGFGGEEVTRSFEPVSRLSFRNVFFLLGSLELVVGLVCFFHGSIPLRLGLVGSLGTCFLIYRLGLVWMGYHLPCSCIGNLTDPMHISPHTADTAMKIVLAYLLTGSYGALFWLWRQNKFLEHSRPAIGMPTASVE